MKTGLPTATYPPLEDLRFRAKVDFVSLATPGRLDLPSLDGRRIWVRSDHGRTLTVHDASPADVRAIAALHPDLRIRALEVAVDVSPAPWVAAASRPAVLDGVMQKMFAKCLAPQYRGVKPYFRGAWRAGGPKPFNKRLPSPRDQLLYGHKLDNWQTKAYFKKVDMGAALDEKQWVARVEVALKLQQLDQHGLLRASDLIGFRFRSELSRYFVHVAAVAPRAVGRTRIGQFHRVLLEKQEQLLAAEFEKVGIGCSLRGGRFDYLDVREWRDQAVNDRIGQALHRLQSALSD